MVQYLVTAQEMKQCDNNTIEQQGMTSEVLMERAALSVVEEINKAGWGKKKTLVVCGSGNNGGDGFAIGRLLFLQGTPVKILFAGKSEKMTRETGVQYKIAENYGVPVVNRFPEENFEVIVDALFGIGITRDVEGDFYTIIDRIEKQHCTGTKVLAVDIPSGIHTDTGKVMNIGIKADLTVTFAYRKLGTVLYPGADYCGRMVVKNIGITDHGFMKKMPKAFTYDAEDLEKLPERANDGNKGTFGKVLVIAGSEGMSGAAYLCGKGAFRAGAGMVQIYTWDGNREVLQNLLPEAIITTYPEGEQDHLKLEKCLCWADVVCIGPGLGQSETAKAALEKVLELNKKPLVADADGLNLIAGNQMDIKGKSYPVVVTPHPGEMARLTGLETGYIKEHMAETAIRYAKENQLICVLKDARTVVAWGEDTYYVNTSGNSGMATAGSGDVLAGIIAGLAGQGLELSESARLGTFLHGIAGDRAGKAYGKAAVMASDIINFLGNEGRME